MKDAEAAAPAPAAPASSPPPVAKGEGDEAAVRAENHRFNLALVKRTPHDLEYVTPQEILYLLRLCNTYGIDWTFGLEATDEDPEDQTRTFAHPVQDLDGTRVMWTRCRVRRERLLQDPAGVLVPDGDIVWAQQVAGLLSAAIEDVLDRGRL